MNRKFRTKTKLRTGIRLRTLLYAGTVCVSLLFALSFFVVQFFREESGLASNSTMVISGFEVTQDTTSVFRGTALQVMLRINIQTKGVNHKLNLSSIKLSARGSSADAFKMIENARLWTTGQVSQFSASRQLGTTIKAIPAGNFEVNCTQSLQDGNNYFWLTYDILPATANGNYAADAECVSIKIGTLEYDPPVAAPPGARTILNNLPYFSTGSGDISSLESWNSSRDGSGTTPSNFNQAPATFHIQAGHIMQNTLAACLPALLIEKNGVLKSSSDIRVNLLEIQPGGTCIQEKVLSKPESVKIFKIRDNGNFIHANTGKLPGLRKVIEPNSTTILTSYSTTTFSEKIDWGNLVIDAKEITAVNFGHGLNNIQGDLELRATGKNEYLFTSASDTIYIAGNLVINGGRLVLSSENNTVHLVIGKSLSVKNGWLSDQIKGKQGKGKLELVSGTGLAFTGGECRITEKGSSIKIAGKNSTWIQQAKAVVKLPDVLICEQSKLTVLGELIGEIESGRKITIQKNAIINFENAVLTGEGTFILEDGATISTGHPDGINSEGNLGCIQTTKRIFHSGANYFYTGYSSPQKTGVFVTSPAFETVNNLGISKASPLSILILSQNFNISGTMIQSRGSINKNNHTIMLNNQGEAAVTPSKEPGSYF